jgi:hypothetical protein
MAEIVSQKDVAQQQWASENKQTGAATSGVMPVCPSAGPTATFAPSYSINEVTNSPACLMDPGNHALQRLKPRDARNLNPQQFVTTGGPGVRIAGR